VCLLLALGLTEHHKRAVPGSISSIHLEIQGSISPLLFMKDKQLVSGKNLLKDETRIPSP